LKEVEGHDVESDFLTPNAVARKEHGNEIELKLILIQHLQGLEFHREHHCGEESFQ
jgi:hypothetical protein